MSRGVLEVMAEDALAADCDRLRSGWTLAEIDQQRGESAHARATVERMAEALEEMTALASGPSGGVSQQQKRDVLAKSRAALAAYHGDKP